MRIFCKLCHQPLEGADDAALGGLLAEHVVKTHPKDAAALRDEIPACLALLSGYLLTLRYADIPDSEAEYQARFETVQRELLARLGLEISESVS